MQTSGRTYVVAQRHPEASDDGAGSQQRPFKTISKAAGIAQPGDTVRVHEGVYHEWVAPARGGVEGRPITYEAAPGEPVIVRGSEVYTGDWQPVAGHPGVYRTQVPDDFFTAAFNPFKTVFSPYRGGGRQGQVFIDDAEMTEARDLFKYDRKTRTRTTEKLGMDLMYEQPNSWATEDGQTIYLHLPAGAKAPDQCRVEISVRRRCFAPVRRAQNYIIVRGFTFEHCANGAAFPQMGMVSCRSGQHWIIENNTIRFAKTVGLDCGAEAESEEDIWFIPDTLDEDRFRVGSHMDNWTLADRRITGRHLVAGNTVADCGQCGIAGLFSDGSQFVGNVIERCGRVVPGFESGGIKVHGLMAGTVEANLVRDNESWGIWLDCGYIGSRVTRNVVVNNKPSGIFLELSEGPALVDNNIVACNRGDGIYTHDSHGVVIAHNLVFGNTQFGIYMHIATDRETSAYFYATRRQRIPGGASWERVYNNIVLDNADGAISLPLPSPRVQDNRSDYNVVSGAGGKAPAFVINANNGQAGGAEAVKDAAREAFRRTGDSGLSAAELVTWKDRGMSMNLRQWQAATGNDPHTIIGHVSAWLDLNRLELIVDADDSPRRLACPPVPDWDIRDFARYQRAIDRDFAGRPMPDNDGPRLAGALQELTAPGRTQLTVWPVAYERPAMPPSVTPQPSPTARDLRAIPRPEPSKA